MTRQAPRIVSGGQTGADRGALDAAIELGIDCGGYCPRGRRAEDGAIPSHYPLTETDSQRYEVRTAMNVRESGATLIVSYGVPTGGTALTMRLARDSGRPLLHVDLNVTPTAQAATLVRQFLADEGIATLNVAGPRESGQPGIAQAVRALLLTALSGLR